MSNFQSASASQTAGLGKVLGGLLRSGDIVLLEGDLAAGKTVFAQGIAAGLGVAEEVTSPTYTIVQIYQGRVPLYHFDLYRLDHEAELFDIGFDELVNGEGVCLIEWPDKFPDMMPEEHLLVKIRPGIGDEGREILLLPQGHRYEEICKELAQACRC